MVFVKKIAGLARNDGDGVCGGSIVCVRYELVGSDAHIAPKTTTSTTALA